MNPGDDAELKAKDFLIKHFPQAQDLSKKTDDNFMDQGGWVIRADSKTDKTMTFLLVISLLQ